MVMVDPKDGNCKKANGKADHLGRNPQQRFQYSWDGCVREIWRVNLKVQQRDNDGDHAVAKCFDAICPLNQVGMVMILQFNFLKEIYAQWEA